MGPIVDVCVKKFLDFVICHTPQLISTTGAFLPPYLCLGQLSPFFSLNLLFLCQQYNRLFMNPLIIRDNYNLFITSFFSTFMSSINVDVFGYHCAYFKVSDQGIKSLEYLLLQDV